MPKPNQSFQPIKKANQTKLEVTTFTRSQCKGWGNVCEWVTIGFGVTSDWIKKKKTVIKK